MLIDKLTKETVPGNKVQCDDKERLALAIAFLRGSVYAWCNVMKDKPFRFATFAGGDNYYWDETELYYLYDKQKSAGSANDDSALREAAKEGGGLLRYMLSEDRRKFETWISEDGRREYAWVYEAKS